MRDILSELQDSFELPAPDPMGSAQRSMRPHLPKRFYKEVSVVEGEGGFNIHLDDRAVKTPSKQTLVFLTKAAADHVALEFSAQREVLDPKLMPCFRLANTAADGVAQDMQAVKEDILRFCGTDLLCYRADTPEDLVNRQCAVWDGPLDWAENLLSAQFTLVEGVIHVAQPRETIAAYGAQLTSIDDPLTLSAFHSMMTLTGSAILALAIYKGHMSAADAWIASYLDDDYMIEQWGEDEEAKDRRAYRWAEMDAADRMMKALQKRD